MNKRIILIPILLIALAGCKPGAQERNFPVLPDELKDCKFFTLADANGRQIAVARCPNSTTTVIDERKHKNTTITIDGKEYIAK